jgi:hypothetical protein
MDYVPLYNGEHETRIVNVTATFKGSERDWPGHSSPAAASPISPLPVFPPKIRIGFVKVRHP